MRHAILIEPVTQNRTRIQRRLLMLVLGLAILTALAVSDAKPAARYQGFSQAPQSLSFMPETVRLKAPK